MILKVAWRNIWRSPLRSIIVLTSIVLGIWAGVFVISFSYGLNNQRVAEAIYSNISHVQIHNPKFEQEESVANALPDVNAIRQVLDKHQTEIKSYSIRTVFNGMVQSASAARGARVMGVNPQAEEAVSTIPQKLTGGDWFETTKRNPLIIGKRLSEILNVKIGSKVVLTFQDADNNIISARFTVTGIYKSANSKLDELIVYCNQQDIYTLINGVLDQEVAVLTYETEQAVPLANSLSKELPNLSVKSWREISPELSYSDEILATSLMLIMSIIMLALMFGIINNMLMAILERKHELGMLQAVGMNKQRIFGMIVLETLLIGLVAGPLGILLGAATTRYFSNTGIDLSIFGEGLESFGISTRIYPELDFSFMLIVGLMVVIMSLLASIYPAIKALRLNPVEAIRSI